MKCLVKFMTVLALLIAVLAVVNADSIVRHVRTSARPHVRTSARPHVRG
jgi:nucleoside diphosphate kinase